MTDMSSRLSAAVAEKSMIRLVVKLRPANADGLVYPPTYDQGTHIFRPAWINGEKRAGVVLDSVQSQANRIEVAILDASRRNRITYPDIELRIKASTGEEVYSVLELSHRVYDAALRMANLNGTLFVNSEIGKQVYAARTERASALFTHAPVTLALGGWDSHGGGGPLVAKMPRLITSEIVGLDAQPVTRGAVKFDPMDIRKDAGPIYESADAVRRFEIDKSKATKNKKEYKPSEIGLGSVPNLSERGAVITEAIQTSIVSLSAVRRLRFETGSGDFSDARDLAGQSAVVALGLFGLLAYMDTGYYLRSGCDLVPQSEPVLEIIGRTLEDIDSIPIDAKAALDTLKTCLKGAEDQKLEWRKTKVMVEADERLVALVERSRKSKVGE
jgi:CRISPR-associated protein Csb1